MYHVIYCSKGAFAVATRHLLQRAAAADDPWTCQQLAFRDQLAAGLVQRRLIQHRRTLKRCWSLIQYRRIQYTTLCYNMLLLQMTPWTCQQMARIYSKTNTNATLCSHIHDLCQLIIVYLDRQSQNQSTCVGHWQELVRNKRILQMCVVCAAQPASEFSLWHDI